MESGLAKLRKTLAAYDNLRFNGLVQGRFTLAQNSAEGVDADGNSNVRDGFFVPRARLRPAWENEWSRLLFEFDVSSTGASLKAAEASLIEPWTGWRITLTGGQLKWPFGFEIPLSSAERPLLEASRVSLAFLRGEYDRGARLSASPKYWRLAVAVVDGNGTGERITPLQPVLARDHDRRKDVVGRIGVDFKWISGGVSGWLGKTVDPRTLVVHDRNRAALDLQLSLSLVPAGKSVLMTEYLEGTSYFAPNGVEQYSHARGWYVLALQSFGSSAVAARYDWFDPDVDLGNGTQAGNPRRPLATNSIGTVGMALIHNWDEALRLTALYEIPTTAGGGGDDPDDNVFTLQMQARF